MNDELKTISHSSFIVPHSSFAFRCPLPDLLVLFAVELLLHIVAKRDLHERHDRLVRLLAALELEQIIISTARARRILATDCGARVIDRTAARLRVEKLASLAEDRIGLAPQHRLILPLRR